MRHQTSKARQDDATFREGFGGMCITGCGRPATEASHRATRAQRPDLRGDPANRDNLCSECHAEVTASAVHGRATGLRSDETYEAANTDLLAKVVRRTKRGRKPFDPLKQKRVRE